MTYEVSMTIGKGSMTRFVLATLMLAVLAGCGGRDEDPNLLNIRQPRSEGPDEFAVLPTKPLEMPGDNTLPAPTPGGSNRTDPTPQADTAAALGGNAGVLARPSGDGALIAYTGRHGRNPNIREELAAADLEYRRNNDGRLLERVFNVNVYFEAYEEMSLDQYRELERLRRAGIRTSAAPPDPTLEE